MTVETWKDWILRCLAAADDGQALVEYALIIVSISVGVFAAMTFLQSQISALFSQVGSML
jgi:Flp pilus assembly pilin Flp